MMGFGAYGSGGSYFSQPPSNLSASAPPFTIDRSPKPGSVPLMDLLEPSYSGPTNSSLNHWLPSETNFFSNSNSELNISPSPNSAYRYQGSPTPNLSSVVSASSENVTNAYHPPYLSPPSHKEGPFVSPDQPRYDWSSTSRVSLSLDGSSSDYSRGASDSKYGSGLNGGLWNGFDEWKQGKHGTFDAGFSSKRTEGNVPSMYENYMNPEAQVPKCLNSGVEALNGVNILDMENHNAEKSNGNAFLKTSNFVPLEYSRSILGSIPELSETRLESPSLIYGSNHVNHQLPYNPAFGSSSSSSGNAPYKSSNSGCEASDEDRSSKRVPITKEYQSQSIPELQVHLERDNDARSELRIPNQSHERINLEISANEARDLSEGVDHCSHAVDSPCWKGVPGGHAFPFDASEFFPDLKNIDRANRVSRSTNSDREASSDKPNELGNSVPGESKSENKGVKNTKEIKITDFLEQVEDDSRTGFNYSNGSLLSPAIDVPGLVKTIHNLSELLMFHCVNGSFQLKQNEDVNVQNAMNNLRMCMSKNPEESTNVTSHGCEDLSTLHKDSTAERSEVAKREASIRVILNSQNLHEKNDYFLSGKEDGMLDSVFVKRDVDMEAEVKATQSLKAVLTENFNEEEAEPQTLLFKNLWLEAEAALCSVTYKARYNRMKMELENSKFHKSKDAKEPPNTELSQADISSPKVEGIPVTNSEERSSASTNTNNHDEEVMARFQILKCRIESSNSGPAEITDKPSPNSTTTPDRQIPEAREQMASPKPESDSSTNKDINDFDASVMARFQILKSRSENCSPVSAEMPAHHSPASREVQAPVETYLPRFVSQRSYWPLIASLSENPDHETMEGPFSGSGFGNPVGDDPIGRSQPSIGAENPLLVGSGWYDRVPSDWEHVRKEDLGFNNH